MLDEESSNSHFNRYIENICMGYKVDFICGKQKIEERMKRLAEKNYDVLLADEVKVAKDPAYHNDQAPAGILRWTFIKYFPVQKIDIVSKDKLS